MSQTIYPTMSNSATATQKTVKRSQTFDPDRGLLANDHFQIAFATNDIDQAKTLLSERYNISEYQQLKGTMPAGGNIHVELAWAGNMMYELVMASGPGSEIFMSRLPSNPNQGFVLQHHHLGFLIYSEQHWLALHELVNQKSYNLLSENNNEGFMRHCFVDAPELGYYLEFIYPEQAGFDFFENIPRN